MAKRKSVTLSRRPIHNTSAEEGMAHATLSGDFIPAGVPSLDTGQAPAQFQSGPLAHAAYGLAYGLSFGCVFSAIVLSRMLPGHAIVARGLGDGAVAAKRAASGFTGLESANADRASRSDGADASFTAA